MANNQILHLPMRKQYFEQIISGQKPLEFRLASDYWRQRILSKPFEAVKITSGYPALDDKARQSMRVWRGFSETIITHEHFGPDPVEVFAIDVSCPCNCRHCGGDMAKGVATKQTFTGCGDFHSDDQPITLSPGGAGRIADCFKCIDCGWSVQ